MPRRRVRLKDIVDKRLAEGLPDGDQIDRLVAKGHVVLDSIVEWVEGLDDAIDLVKTKMFGAERRKLPILGTFPQDREMIITDATDSTPDRDLLADDPDSNLSGD